MVVCFTTMEEPLDRCHGCHHVKRPLSEQERCVTRKEEVFFYLPCPSFPCFLEFIVFSPCEEFPVFPSIFPSFSGI